MRKRKFKLISTVAAMAMVLGVMGVGVYAATSQTLNITTTVSFTAKDVSAKVEAKTTGDYISTAVFTGNGLTSGSTDATYGNSKVESPITIYDTSDNNKKSSSVSLALALTDNNQGYIANGATIGAITYTITNNLSTPLYLKPLDLQIASDYSSKISVAVAYDTTTATNQFTTVSGKLGYALAGNVSSTVTVTFTALQQIDSTFTVAGLFASGKDMAFNFVNATGQLEKAAGLYTDTNYTTLAKVTVNSQSVDATWANIVAAYPSAFETTGAIEGYYDADYQGYCSYFGSSLSGALVIPSSVTSIGYAAFRNCTGLTSISIGSNVTSIGNSAFQGCSGLTSVAIPSSVISIGDSAFHSSYNITSITIGSGVTSIGENAFGQCNLKSIEIPSSVTNIARWAFSNTNLTSVEFKTTSGWYVGDSAGAKTTAVDVTNTSTNATNLTNGDYDNPVGYASKYWTRG